ncbi:MinD-like ATPase involved in chromosome partitioning or flagellar assembly [Nocardia farcinica]|uniref:Flp pilus assembly protein, ATPase CpaE n=1 Tax=Nocardia farcinica TaxID=37329 RepID=A0A0H5NZ83_NOCFR|nr:ESX-1 secretion-associated protein EspI [Nocardia farcinica]PFX06624.1 ESX-1 secretion-associated protein EspI [Nocardia farcinica]CRY80583.1 Flp pilus assembly protein%2C ATPase CpaE [Nocardia farcinica]SIT06786.1 MinD-like ATPase involved in chromosome partitioning or flagellar assembly [Nocardia farcinica]SUE31241.1 Flp pilus assembly protein, ATPase CpaE [Nocardia farcinica]
MTNNDHNPTSPPWLQSHPVDTAEPSASSKAQDEHDPTDTAAEPGEQAESATAARTPEAGEPAPEPAAAGFAPPGFGPEGAGPAPDQFAPYGSGQFAQAGAPHPGGFAPPPPPQPGPPSAPYSEYRQEIGPDGMVRRVPQDGAEGVGPQSSTGEQPSYSWAPPPPPTAPMPPQQPPMYQQPGGAPDPGQPWPGGPQQYGQPPQQFGQPQPQFGQPPQPQYGQPQMPPGHSVNDLNLLKRARRAPRSGWRRAVHKASGGIINPGESAADIVYRDLVERVNQPVRGDYRIAILSLKGGVGKTTTTVGLGSTFASLRGDRVIAIDANPDLGTLAHRVPRQTRSTVRNLLEDQHISRYSDVRAHTSQAPSRLEVLASEQDPAVSEAFSEADYRKAIGILQSFYNIILTDCGTGLMHSAMAGVLDMASSLVLVTSPAIDGARSASATLDWLEHHGYGKLVERTVVVVNASRRGASTVDLDQLRKLFLDRTRAVQVVPFDDHLAEGAEIDLELVSKPTRRALLELAAMVADDFGYVGAQQYQQPGPMDRR